MSQSISAESRLVGSWSLVTFEQVLHSGEVLKPFGDSPSGSIIYQADGRMSAQVSVGNRARFASDDPDRATTEEAEKAWQTYFGYWGTYEVNAEKQVVMHRVEDCSFPNWVGTIQVRHFRFAQDNRLILETQSPSGQWKVTWQRDP